MTSYCDIKIDNTTGDISHSEGRINIIQGRDEISQRIMTVLRRLQGEWFTDTTIGIPYYQELLGKKDFSYLDLIIRQEVLKVSGVISIKELNQITINDSVSLFMIVQTSVGDVEIREDI